MGSKVVIFGIGRLARSVCFYLTHDSPHDVVGFTVDAEHMEARKVENLPVVPFERIATEFPPDRFEMIIAVGYRRLNPMRVEKYHAAREMGYRLVSYISSKTTCWESAHLGENLIIFENNVIQPTARIGDGVIIWCGVHVGSGASIGDHCYLGSNAVIESGARVGARSFIGANATIRYNAAVGSDCLIGAGACILSNAADGGVYAHPPPARNGIAPDSFARLMDIDR